MVKTDRRSFLSAASLALGSSVGTGFAAKAPSTSVPARPGLRFAVTSDGHFGQPDTDFQRFHREMIQWLNEEEKGKGLDFVIFNGDLIHDDPLLLPQVRDAYSGLNVPYYTVQGNHDQVTPSAWKEVWGLEVNHAFEKDRFGFVLATTTDGAGKYLCGNESWLQDQLHALRDKESIFAFLHICQTAVTRHGISCPGVQALFHETANLVGVFHGHDHDQDNVIWVDGRPYFFDGHLGGSWGTRYRGYRIVEVDSAGKAVTYQCNPEAFLVNSTPLSG